MAVGLALRRSLLARAGYSCEECGRPAPREHPLWCGLGIHHIHERARGGDDTPENLLVLCGRCHSAKHPGKSRLYAGVTLDPPDFAAVERLADQAGWSMSATLRELVGLAIGLLQDERTGENRTELLRRLLREEAVRLGLAAREGVD